LDTGRTGKESRLIGLADYLEERSQVEKLIFPFSSQPLARFRSATVMAMPLPERKAWVLILPQIFFTA
jgi:hypothetical protein